MVRVDTIRGYDYIGFIPIKLSSDACCRETLNWLVALIWMAVVLRHVNIIPLTILEPLPTCSTLNTQGAALTTSIIPVFKFVGRLSNIRPISEIQIFSFKKIDLKMSSGKWRPFCLGFNMLTNTENRQWAVDHQGLVIIRRIYTHCLDCIIIIIAKIHMFSSVFRINTIDPTERHSIQLTSNSS